MEKVRKSGVNLPHGFQVEKMCQEAGFFMDRSEYFSEDAYFMFAQAQRLIRESEIPSCTCFLLLVTLNVIE